MTASPHAQQLYPAMQRYFPEEVLKQLKVMGEVADTYQCQLYLIGGSVRDMLLPGRAFDWDLDMMSADPRLFEVATALHKRWGGSFQQFEQYGTAKLRLETLELDFARARTEVYTEPGANPVVAFASVKKDLVRRDFTINAMAISLNQEHFGEIFDPFEGLEDLYARRLRALHSQKFIEDPVRSWRAVRFSVALQFSLVQGTVKWISEAMHSGVFDGFVNARIVRELRKVLAAPDPLPYFKDLAALGVWRCLGDMRFWGPDFIQFCQAVPRWRMCWSTDLAPSVYLLGILAFLQPFEVEPLLPLLEMSKTESAAWEAWCAFDPEALERASQNSLAAVHAVLSELPPLCCWLVSAFYTYTPLRAVLHNYAHELQYVRLALTGKDLLQWTHPGPHLKIILQQLLFAKLNGEISTREDELRMAQRLACPDSIGPH
jgi:tRNA nucleotidyltransferase (CCA-adding enzyme)